MSHNTVIKTDLTDDEILPIAIEDLGFPVERGRNLDLYDFLGRKQPQKADFVIRRKHLGPVSNDIGFVRVGGKYKVVISDIDKGQVKKGKFIEKLTHRYNVLKVKKEVARQGLRLIDEKVRTDGTVELVVTT